MTSFGKIDMAFWLIDSQHFSKIENVTSIYNMIFLIVINDTDVNVSWSCPSMQNSQLEHVKRITFHYTQNHAKDISIMKQRFCCSKTWERWFPWRCRTTAFDLICCSFFGVDRWVSLPAKIVHLFHSQTQKA